MGAGGAASDLAADGEVDGMGDAGLPVHAGELLDDGLAQQVGYGEFSHDAPPAEYEGGYAPAQDGEGQYDASAQEGEEGFAYAAEGTAEEYYAAAEFDQSADGDEAFPAGEESYEYWQQRAGSKRARPKDEVEDEEEPESARMRFNEEAGADGEAAEEQEASGGATTELYVGLEQFKETDATHE